MIANSKIKPKSDKPEMPYAKTEATKYFAKALEAIVGREISPGVYLSRRDIATESGYTAHNIFSMFKSGETKIPIDRALAMAKALRVDPAHFMRLVMKQHWPEVAAQLDALFGGPLSANERKLLELWRKATKNADPELDAAMKQRLRAAIQGVAVEMTIAAE